MAASGVSAVSLFVLSNTALALTRPDNRAALFSIPFIEKTYVLPLWMWGRVPTSVWAISTLVAVILGMTVLVRTWWTQRS